MSLRPLALLAVAALGLAARADSPAPHAPPVGWVPGEGFRLKSEDGDYLLRAALQAAFKLEPTWVDGEDRLNATFAFLRPSLRGNVVQPWIRYWLSLELSGETPFVLDAFFELEPWEALGIRVGQQGTPVSRHANLGPQQIFFPEFSSVTSYFWSGRDKGVTIYGAVADGRLAYYAGLYGGSPLGEPVNLKGDYVVEARATVSPLGAVNGTELPFTPEGDPLPFRISFTLQGYLGQVETDAKNFNPSNGVLSPSVPTPITTHTATASADVWLQSGPVIVFGELYWRRLDPIGIAAPFSSFGAWAEAIVALSRNHLGAGVRAGWINPNVDLPDASAVEVEAQLAWFLQPPALALKLRYGLLHQQTPDPDALGTFVLPFAAGTTHVVTLQLNLFF